MASPENKPHINNLEPEPTYPYDAIAVLGSNMKVDPNTGKIIFPTVMPQKTAEGIKDMVVAGKSRAIATAQASEERLAPKFIIIGGTQEGLPVSNAQALADLIMQRYKVPNTSLVILEGPPEENNTMGNIKLLAEYLSQHPDDKNIGVLTNIWHMRRVLAMCKTSEILQASGVKFTPIIVERILERRSPFYKSWRQDVTNTDAMKNRVSAEKQGLDALGKGTYK